jgi:hypothetical protein
VGTAAEEAVAAAEVIAVAAADVDSEHRISLSRFREVPMSPSETHAIRKMNSRRNLRVALGVIALLSAGAFQVSASDKQTTFKSPDAAVDALVSAVKAGDTNAIIAVLGPSGRKLATSGDPVADAAARQRFTSAYDESHTLKQEGDTRSVLVLGKDDFPFPIPVVADAGGTWRFDTEAGAEEIIDRRIGENELAAINVLAALVDAQREYADGDRDGKGPQYARKLLSSTGKKDGLFWPSEEGQDESPLGPLVANARVEGYRRTSEAVPPYHGYLFKVLTSQGKDAPGGARDYVLQGRMIGGYAFLAEPAEYGSSGVMTFVVNQDGDVFQKDLGPDTTEIAADTTEFNPDSTWTKVDRQ